MFQSPSNPVVILKFEKNTFKYDRTENYFAALDHALRIDAIGSSGRLTEVWINGEKLSDEKLSDEFSIIATSHRVMSERAEAASKRFK